MSATLPDEPNAQITSRTSNWRLKLVVVVAGAVLMALEMTGSRVLAIYFGSSIYVWGAIIGIFLAALSLGYYSGGLLADRRPTFFLLNVLILVAGCWLLLIPLFANRVCYVVVSLNTGERLGPLIATLVLFGGPSVLLGTVSPYAVRLAARTVETMGNVSGKLYALSTFGSIAGTLLTAFWLIPAIGVRTLLQVLGLCLVLLPPIVLPGSRAFRSLPLVIVLGVVGLILFGRSTFVSVAVNQTLIYETDSPYHYIQIVDDKQKNARYLRFNNYIEGAISLDPPYDTRMSYTNAFELARLFKTDLKKILIIGGGGGIGARKFVADDANAEVDLVEIDPRVVELSFKYFYLQPSSRLRVHVADGRNFIRQSSGKYDLVVLDALTIGGQIPFHLTTREFLQEIEQVLTPGGVLLANINGSLRGPRSQIVRSEYKTASSVFDNIYLFPHLLDAERTDARLDPDRKRNIILVAVNGPAISKMSIAVVAAKLESSGLVRSPTFLQDATQLLTDKLPLNDVPLLTDDYAPVDTMVF